MEQLGFDPQSYIEKLADLPEEDINLGRSAIALGALQQPGISVDRYFNHLERLISEVGERHAVLLEAGAEDDAGTQLAALKEILVQHHGYSGDQETYDDIQNANLIRVIERLKGQPIALSILYMHVGEALGWQVRGLNMPGHFVCRVDLGSQRLIFDPFHDCKLLEAPDLRLMVKVALGDEAELSSGFFEPVSKREVLVRLQNRVKYVKIEMEDYAGALEIVKTMRLIDPEERRVLLDEGVLYAKLRKPEAAIESLEAYIEKAPYDRHRQQAWILLQEIRQGLY